MSKKFNSKCAVNKEGNLYPNDLKVLKYLYDFREGVRAFNIVKYTGIKERTVYKRLNILRDKNLVIDEFPIWKLVNGQVKFVQSLLKSSKNIFELHNPGYVVKLLEIPKWWNPKGTQMKNKLMMIKGYKFQQVDFGKNASTPFIQLKNERFVIQMYPESVIIIHRKRYYSKDPYELTIDFMNDFYDLWAWFEERMKFKFFKDGVPQMFLRGHDYNRINDWMANYVKKKIKKRFIIELGDGRKVWVDLSEPFGKEANTPEIQVMLEKVTKDRIINKPMLPSEIQGLVFETSKQINRLTEVQLLEQQNKAEYSRDLVQHKEAIKTMGFNTEANTKSIEMLAGIIKELKDKFK